MTTPNSNHSPRRNYSHSTLPPEFIRYWRELNQSTGRTRSVAHRLLMSSWRAGESIPGYGTWREWFSVMFPDREVPQKFCGDYPTGWSARNLYNYAPTTAEMAPYRAARVIADKVSCAQLMKPNTEK